ncbi:MAG: hypothetical protein AB1478_11695, partial [Nitrospirota bacterium]
MAKGNFAQGALSFLGGLGSLSALAKAGDLANLGKVGQQIGNLATSINKAKTISGLTNLANSFNKINQLSIAAFGNDLSDGSGRKIQGVNRFLAGLSYAGSGSIKLPGLNAESVKYLTTTYKLGVSITGKQNIIGGKQISDEERFNLGASALAPYLGQSFASAKDANRLGFNPGSILNVGRDVFAAGQLAFQYASNAYNAAGRWVTDPGTLVRDIGVMGKEIGKGAYEAAKGGVKESRQGLSYAASLVKDGLSDFNKAINYVARNEAIGKVVNGLVMGSVNRLVMEITGRDPGLSLDELNKIPGVKQFMEKANTASQRLSHFYDDDESLSQAITDWMGGRFDEVVKGVTKWFTDKGGKIAIPEIKNTGKSTTTSDMINDRNRAEVKKESAKASEVISKAIKEVQNMLKEANINIASESGQAIAEKYLKAALKDYPHLANGVTAASLIGAAGTFDPKLLGDPTDVA